MKKHYLLYACMSLLSTTLIFSVQNTQQIKTGIEQLKKQNKEITPLSVKAINTVKKALETLDHTAFCLITGKKCTPRDRITVNYALGFAVGASYNIYPIAQLLARHKITDKEWTGMAGQMAAEMALTAAKLKGTILTPFTSAMEQAILSAIFLIGDIKQAVEKAMERESVFMFLKELSTYLAKDVQCIWSESYCQIFGLETFRMDEKINPAAKREALYFWLGILSGFLVKRGVIETIKKSSLGKQVRAFGGSAYEHTRAFVETIPTRTESVKSRFKY